MSSLYSRITKILSEHDPMDLVVMGAPKDEYSSEAEEIAQKLPSCRSVAEVNEIVYSTFVKSFEYGARMGEKKTRHTDPGGAGEKGDYLEMSKKFLRLL